MSWFAKPCNTIAVLLETQINWIQSIIESHLLLYSAPNIPFTQIYHNTQMQLRRLMYCSTEPKPGQASAGWNGSELGCFFVAVRNTGWWNQTYDLWVIKFLFFKNGLIVNLSSTLSYTSRAEYLEIKKCLEGNSKMVKFKCGFSVRVDLARVCSLTNSNLGKGKKRQSNHILWISPLPPPYPHRPKLIIFIVRNFFIHIREPPLALIHFYQKN